DRDAQAHEANLYDLNAKYADVVSLREVLDSLPG
ncbi:MAG: isochorismatase, partial [Proteobacteria bacterium]|nr:isochorismatase [Pseudomonadota bacterium]